MTVRPCCGLCRILCISKALRKALQGVFRKISTRGAIEASGSEICQTEEQRIEDLMHSN